MKTRTLFVTLSGLSTAAVVARAISVSARASASQSSVPIRQSRASATPGAP